MKVLIIHTSYLERGGEDTVFENESHLLKSKGVIVEDLIFNNKKCRAFKLLLAPFNLFSFYKVKQSVKNFKPDIIHIHNWHFAASPSVVWAAYLCNIPIIMTLHNYRLICPSGILYYNGEIFLESIKGGFPWAAVKKKVYRNSLFFSFWLAVVIRLHLKLRTWDKVTRLITLTNFSRDLLLRSDLNIIPKKIIVKPHFTQDPEEKNGQREQRFIYVGRLSEEKGIDLIFKAFQIKKFNLIIIGDGPLKNEVKMFASCNPEVEYFGYQEPETIQTMLQTSSALLFCSKCYETMGMTILESFANGLPVIAAALGSIPEIVINDYNGILFNNNDPIDLSLKISIWNLIPAIDKEKLSKNAKDTFIKKYAADINYHRLMSIYQEAIQAEGKQ